MKKMIMSLALVGLITTSIFAEDSAQVLIEKNACMSCHNIMGMKDAPPFAGIAWRNSRLGNNAKDTLKSSIKNGSHGKYPMFSNTKMPSFSHLSDQELNRLATWVLSQSQNMDKCGMGKCGSSMNNSSKGWW